MEQEPFKSFTIDDFGFLNDLDERGVCFKCKKSRKFFCYTCYVPLESIRTKVPSVRLPVKIDIIKHPNECEGKSTSAHAAILAPEDVTIYTFPCIPNYDPDKVILIFPGDDAQSLDKLKCNKLPSGGDKQCLPPAPVVTEERKSDNASACLSSSETNDLKISEKVTSNKRKAENVVEFCDKRFRTAENQNLSSSPIPFERAVFIDSTWNQTKRISLDERLSGLLKVEITSRVSHFWRHQKDLPPTYLSTIEAVYYLLKDCHTLFLDDDYKGQYDNLLFFFSFMYSRIHKMYGGGKNLQAFKQRNAGRNKEEEKA